MSLVLSIVLLLSVLSTNVFAQDTLTEKSNNKTDDMAFEHLQDYTAESTISNELLSSIVNSSSKEDTLQINPSMSFSTSYSSADIITSIKSEDDFAIEGFLTVGTENYNINDYYDFSSTSKYHVADWACSAELISESEKIDCFCDLILQRNFDNIDCLEGVFDSIQQYQANNILPSNLNEKISEVLSVPFDTNGENSERSISNKKTYSSENFTIHYDSTKTTSTVAKSVADCFEEIRTDYIDLGFETPQLQLLNSRYQVYLDPDSDPDGTAAATTTKSATLTNTCASYITIYNFSSLTTDVKERIAHEYFHAIQNAYNHQSGWFKEACANWGKLIVGGSSNTCEGQIQTFITGTTSMPETSGYGAVVFPLAIHYKYGGANAIVSIYESYNDYSASINESQLRDVITIGINNTGTTEGFSATYRAMASYLFSTTTWYSSVYAGASGWSNAPMTTTTVSNTSGTSGTNTSTTISGSLSYLTNKYYQLNFPTNFKGAVKIVVDYTDSNGKTQVYTKGTNGVHTINYNATNADGISTFIQPNIGDGVKSVGIILSNLAESGSISYSVSITLLPIEQALSLSAFDRYMERETYIDAGEYIEYNTVFSVGGNKLIQTFGTKDTVLEL